jgi:hypothetical protein
MQMLLDKNWIYNHHTEWAYLKTKFLFNYSVGTLSFSFKFIEIE